MDELIKQVASAAGISPDQAKKAVQAMLDYVKKQLPVPIAAQVEAAMKGDLSGIEGMLGGLGGMFGKK